MRWIVVYSSRTGNTRRVAEAARDGLADAGADVRLAAIGEAPEPAKDEAVAVGFWVDKGRPDDLARDYLLAEAGKARAVALFGTLGARPDSPHADDVRRAALELAGGEGCLGLYLCQGRIDPRLVEVMARSAHHPMTPERKANIEAAAKHPDEDDLARARAFFRELAGGGQETREARACNE
ncbi:MAG: flavodoxin family protein [Desulfovibrionaceae bacterium]